MTGNRVPPRLSFGHFRKIRNLGTSATGLSPIRSLKSRRSWSVRARAARPSGSVTWSRRRAGAGPLGGSGLLEVTREAVVLRADGQPAAASQRFPVFVRSEGGAVIGCPGPWWPASPRAWWEPPCCAGPPRCCHCPESPRAACAAAVPPPAPPAACGGPRPGALRASYVSRRLFPSSQRGERVERQDAPVPAFSWAVPSPPPPPRNHVFLWVVVSVSVSVAVLLLPEVESRSPAPAFGSCAPQGRLLWVGCPRWQVSAPHGAPPG